MRKELRLTRANDFRAVRREGRSWSNGVLVLVTRRNGYESSRFGFSVGKRVGNAVVRNKVKRRLKEAVRNARVRPGWDSVLIARKAAATADFQRLSHSMTSLFRRAGLVPTSTRHASFRSKAK